MLVSDLQFESGGNALGQLAASGALPGAVALAAAGMNGPGAGTLAIDAAGNLCWTAPGGAAGAPVDVSAGGTFLLAAADARQWLRVEVYAAYLALPSTAAIALADRYASPLVSADVTAAQAAAGNVATWSVTLHNTSSAAAGTLKIWLDAASYAGVQISLDGTTWSRPTTSAAGLAIGTLAAGASATIYLKRTVAASSPSAASCLISLHASWQTPIVAEIAARGLFRIFNAAGYRLYKSSALPLSLADLWSTVSTLPATPGAVADGTWYFGVSYFDGVYDGGFAPVGPNGEPYLTAVIASGAATPPPPAAPLSLILSEDAPGVCGVTATGPQLAAAALPYQWQLSYTVNGGAATVLAYPYAAGGVAVLAVELPAQAPASVIAVSLVIQRNDGTAGSPVWTSSAAATASLTLAAAGPSPPLAGMTAGTS